MYNTTLVSPVLKLPVSSLALSMYSPSSAGTTAKVELPASAGIKLVEFWNVPVPSDFKL